MSFDRSKCRPGARLPLPVRTGAKGHVLLYPEGMIKLNDSAALIGGLIDGQRDVAAIIASSNNNSPACPSSVTTSSNSWRWPVPQHWIVLA
jgi:pyrroloquinoline quinone biosynthesis protein D